MSVPIQPLGDFVVIEQEVAETRTASGIYLPEKSAEKPKIGKILAVGPRAGSVKPGERVVYGGYVHNPIKIEGKEYLLIKEEDLLGTLK